MQTLQKSQVFPSLTSEVSSVGVGLAPPRYFLEWRHNVVSPLHRQSEGVACEIRDLRAITTTLSQPTTSFDHLDALGMGLVEHLRVVDLPDKVSGSQTASLRNRFLANVIVRVRFMISDWVIEWWIDRVSHLEDTAHLNSESLILPSSQSEAPGHRAWVSWQWQLWGRISQSDHH